MDAAALRRNCMHIDQTGTLQDRVRQQEIRHLRAFIHRQHHDHRDESGQQNKPHGNTIHAKVDAVGCEQVRALLQPRAPDAHKGDFGRVVVVAGSIGKAGAAVLCGQGAMRAGAGLVTVMTDAVPL